MSYLFKKILFSLIFNLVLFTLLTIGLQNSSNKKKVNLFMYESVELPVGFILGVSFISGSILGALITKENKFNK
tara:strand:- start:845 stop:1066 length:222 start_codon:yes stop_codon:yes gene_type:complete